MPAGGFLSGSLHRFCSYTGESFQYLKSSGVGAGPIRPAAGAQAFLEAQVLKALGSPGGRYAHPLGIVRFRIGLDGVPVVFLDSHAEMAIGAIFPTSRTVVEVLLPSYESYIEVQGILDLRVLAVQGRELHVGLVGTDARLVLAASAGSGWAREIRDHERDLVSAGYIPLWTESIRTPFEQEHLAMCPPLHEFALTWLGSGLLRRIGLFRTQPRIVVSRVQAFAFVQKLIGEGGCCLLPGQVSRECHV
ncbi:hypothetical protein SAMN04490220_8400 [Rhodococcus jostii]|uniref:Uncharacterized protein n=1 Tax=Rhodococcus jostii TaxID=132919 RepID=A0A1H5LUY3_RHOJO|nr:hypothetical protein SAMN04490220_8400 [Rhodococcus jostii]